MTFKDDTIVIPQLRNASIYIPQVVIFEDRSDAPSSDEEPVFGSWISAVEGRRDGRTSRQMVRPI